MLQGNQAYFGKKIDEQSDDFSIIVRSVNAPVIYLNKTLNYWKILLPIKTKEIEREVIVFSLKINLTTGAYFRFYWWW